VLRFRGPDASRFLQGQLSNDVERLTTEDSLLAGLHNAQGRTLAVLRLFALQPDDLLAVLPLALLPAVASQLSRYVLRSHLSIADVGAEWRVAGLYGYDAQAAVQLRKRVALDEEGLRYIVVAPRHDPLPEGEAMDFDDWHGMDIATGRPQVYPATSGQFVAQMLNLDVLDAISFDKGCYTGQEVIARAHYRGKVKRRMQRFATEDARQLGPGDRVQIADGRVLHVVDVAPMPGGGWDFLAVAPLAANVVDTALESATARTLDATSLSLPYALPD
jgi:folate-binding protein YgfZ